MITSNCLGCYDELTTLFSHLQNSKKTKEL